MTKLDFLRRRIVPVAFGVAIALMARESCNKEHRTHATIVLDYGAVEATVHAVDAELWVHDEQVSQFHRVALDHARIGSTRFVTALAEPDAELRIDVELASGEHRQIVRRIHADDGATIDVPIERDLR